MPASSPRCACSHSRTPRCVSCCKSAVRTRSATLRKMRIFTTGVKPSGSLMRLPFCRQYGLYRLAALHRHRLRPDASTALDPTGYLERLGALGDLGDLATTCGRVTRRVIGARSEAMSRRLCSPMARKTHAPFAQPLHLGHGWGSGKRGIVGEG